MWREISGGRRPGFILKKFHRMDFEASRFRATQKPTEGKKMYIETKLI